METSDIDEGWLDHANAADLDALAAALEAGRVAPPFSAEQVQAAGLRGEASAFLLGLGQIGRGAPPPAIAWMLRRLARERIAADRRWGEVAHLVWSGPAADQRPARDTRLVLAELFARAERHVLIATFVVYDGRKVFEPLGARMAARPTLNVDLYINLESETGADADEEREAAAFKEEFGRKHWPAGVRLPNLYYDRETRKAGKKRTTLHAKCVVVDERWALITSANFTEAAQARNIETGVLLDHPGIAGTLAARFRGLRETGRVRRM